MNELSDSAVIELLAQREGFTKCICNDIHCGAWFLPKSEETILSYDLPKYDTLDTLQPILATLTDEEWRKLATVVETEHGNDDRLMTYAGLYLTLKPTQLARCIGKVIAGEKGAE